MSGASAIAAVTATLRNLLTAGVTLDTSLADTFVTTLPMDRARDSNISANQLNVFLYQVMPNAAWRNQPMPRQISGFESGVPPLALNLYYLITAYGRDNDAQSPFSHLLLGRAMSILHDHPLLGADEIRLALPRNDLYLQVERVRFTLQPLSVEEIFKLWSGFQTQYRLSASYEAAVVLIESTRGARMPLPVLTRGKGDTGVLVQPEMIPPFPAIDAVEPPNQQNAVQVGDTPLLLHGHHLRGDKVEVVLSAPQLAAPIRLPAQPDSTDTLVKVAIDAAQPWAVALYSLVVEITTGPTTPNPQVRRTNEVPLLLAPTLTLPVRAKLTNGVATVKLKFQPDVGPGQRVSLLIGDREIVAPPRTQAVSTVAFTVTDAVAGTPLIRLRVDGIDSLLIDRSVSPPVFRNQRVTIK